MWEERGGVSHLASGRDQGWEDQQPSRAARIPQDPWTPLPGTVGSWQVHELHGLTERPVATHRESLQPGAHYHLTGAQAQGSMERQCLPLQSPSCVPSVDSDKRFRL